MTSHEVSCLLYPVGTPGVGATEDKPSLHVAALGAVQGFYDAESLAALLVGAFLQTTQVADRLVIPVVSGDLIQVGEDGAPGEPGGAHDETDVLLFAVQIGLFEGISSVTLDGRYKTARHLNAVAPS